MHGNVRVACGKGGDCSLHLPALITIEIADRKGGSPAVCHPFRLEAQVVELIKQHPCLAGEELACGRDVKAATMAMQQGKAQLCLQGLHLLRDGGLAYEAVLGGTRKRPRLDDSTEVLDLTQLHGRHPS